MHQWHRDGFQRVVAGPAVETAPPIERVAQGVAARADRADPCGHVLHSADAGVVDVPTLPGGPHQFLAPGSVQGGQKGRAGRRTQQGHAHAPLGAAHVEPGLAQAGLQHAHEVVIARVDRQIGRPFDLLAQAVEPGCGQVRELFRRDHRLTELVKTHAGAVALVGGAAAHGLHPDQGLEQAQHGRAGQTR